MRVGSAFLVVVFGLYTGGCRDSGGGSGSADVGDTGGSDSAGPSAGPTGDETASGEEGGSTSDGSASESTGGPPTAGADRIGLGATGLNYFELQTEDGPLKFHFGASNSKWAAGTSIVAGDWDGDGLDTVALYDSYARSFLLADQNDTDEFELHGTRVDMLQLPAAPPVGGEAVPLVAVAGDWDGDGVDGVGVFHVGPATFYLRNDLSAGPPDITLTLDAADGYPTAPLPVAGDFDGDGDDEVGVFDRTTVYLKTSLDPGPADITFGAVGFAVAGDFDNSGVDTIATFDPTTNTFAIRHHNGEGAATHEESFGYAEPGQWGWTPITGAWQVPDAPAASDGFEWPEGDPAAHGLGAAALATALDDGSNVADVRSVLVARNGQLIAERYYHGYDRHIAGNIKSVSKGVLSALYGIALEEGAFTSLDDAVSTHVPAYFGSLSAGKQSITIRNIMNMRGGLEWSEGPNYVSGGMVAAPDFVEYVVGLPLVVAPGTVFEYSTGLTHVGSAALTEASGMSSMEFARAKLFERLEISAARWDGSPEGYLTGGAEMWMRPRDMARFGQLYLEGGTIDGEAILTPAWVQASANPTIPESGGRFYGLWWRERNWSNYPFNDTFFAWGYGGQFIFLFPTWDLIVVITSKWNVNGTASGQAANDIFNYVNNSLLTTVTD